LRGYPLKETHSQHQVTNNLDVHFGAFSAWC